MALDEFMRRLPACEPIGSIRNKVCSKGSGFLDMVVEAAWALHFWDAGQQLSIVKSASSLSGSAVAPRWLRVALPNPHVLVHGLVV